MSNLAIALSLLAIGVILLYRPARRFVRDVTTERARELFRLQRERMEARFFDLAAATGKPKGLRWTTCEFHEAVVFARDRKSGALAAFAEVTIGFEPIEGEGMEEVEAAYEKRHAVAVFHYHHGQWGTGGRTLFNLSPAKALELYQDQYEPA